MNDQHTSQPDTPNPSRSLVLAVYWAEGNPDDLTQDAAQALRPLQSGQGVRGVVVSFSETVTQEPGFIKALAQFDVSEVCDV